MRRAWFVVAREWRDYFASPLAYVLIAVFVLVQAGLFYFIGYPIGPVPMPGLWDGGQASLLTLFTWLPLSLALVVPAVTMGLWAEERRGGTEELMLTYPLKAWEWVLGKFIAAWSVVTFAVVLVTLPVAWTVAGLGPLDLSTVVLGLMGSAALVAAYTALAMCASALTSEQLVAFLIGSLILGGLWLLRMLVGYAPAGLAGWLEAASPQSHFLDTAARGVWVAADGLYFAGIAVAGLYWNTLILERRRLQ